MGKKKAGKIGRNDPCPCGSGKKYKKCHLPAIEAASSIKNIQLQPEYLDKQGRLVGRPFLNTVFKGQRVVAVGGRLYHSMPPDWTFHQFLLNRILAGEIGSDWFRVEYQKTESERHIIANWFIELEALAKDSNAKMEDESIQLKSHKMSGNVKELLCLAYDMYSVLHCGQIPKKLLDRLRNKDNFQGARYELAVAAIFARSGFDIQWQAETKRHCEFIAVHKDTGEKIAVEAKSRHRSGVLGRTGKMPKAEIMKAEVEQLFSSALSQNPGGMAFAVFLDLNYPLDPKITTPEQTKWFNDIQQMLKDHYATGSNRDFSVLVITNFAWHYTGDKDVIEKEETITIINQNAKFPVQQPNTLNLLHAATNQYGIVPHKFEEQN